LTTTFVHIGFVSKLRTQLLVYCGVFHVLDHCLLHPGRGGTALPPSLISTRAAIWARKLCQLTLLQALVNLQDVSLLKVVFSPCSVA
jgi:hypothetical protein